RWGEHDDPFRLGLDRDVTIVGRDGHREGSVIVFGITGFTAVPLGDVHIVSDLRRVGAAGVVATTACAEHKETGQHRCGERSGDGRGTHSSSCRSIPVIALTGTASQSARCPSSKAWFAPHLI